MATDKFTGAQPLVVISYYDRRDSACLAALLRSMAAMPAGVAFDVQIVVNATRDAALVVPETPFPVSIAYRENLGMNIGAWDAGWRLNPERPAYLFLQDECLIVRENWLAAFVERCAEPHIGLVGEAFNPAWEAPWQRLRAMHVGATLPDHHVDGQSAPRVDVYLHHMKRWGIDPGESGRHLRSLIWCAGPHVLAAIGGFPNGANYGECIAAEIGVSRAIAARGLSLAQPRPAPFHFIRHREWNQDAPGAPFYHSSKTLNGATWESERRPDLDGEAARVNDLLGLCKDGADTALVISALLRKLEDRDRALEELKGRLK